jgi:hypothetical protein
MWFMARLFSTSLMVNFMNIKILYGSELKQSRVASRNVMAMLSVLLLIFCSRLSFAEPLPVLSVPKAIQIPRMDASVDDPAWRFAAKNNGLTPPRGHDEKTPPSPPTQVSVLWDAKYLYVRFESRDNEVTTPFQERDAFHYLGDVAEIFLDPVGDGRQYYEFQLSPRGGILDQYIVLSDDPIYDPNGRFTPEFKACSYWANLAWNCDGLLTSAKILQQDGRNDWIVEFALPASTVLKRLGQTEFKPGTLRANFLRYDWQFLANPEKRDLVPINWSPVLFGCPHISPGRMGFLELAEAK